MIKLTSKVGVFTLLLFLNSTFTFAQQSAAAKEGCVSGNCVNGKGKFVSTNYTYEGDWKNGVKEGQGTKTNFLGQVYTGQFANDQYEGKGKLDYGNGVYIGDFVNGKEEGKGTMTTAIYIYVGDFKNGRKEGSGKMTNLMTDSVIEGKFKEGKFIP